MALPANQVCIGLDFGTTNTSVAVYDGQLLTLLPIDPASPDPRIMRTALFLTRPTPETNLRSVAYIGREAIDRFTAGNVGRVIHYERNWIGNIELELGDLGMVLMPMVVEVDANSPGRLFQSLKSELREGTHVDSNVFGTRYSLESLLAVILKQIVERAESAINRNISGLVIGRPVHYANTPEADALAFARMQEACRLAELPNVSFLEEPTAAALDYTRQVQREQHVVVFDFGGGTFDVTVMRSNADGRNTFLATDGVPVGGDLLDKRIVMGKLTKIFGQGALMGRERLPVPNYIYEFLGQWESIIELSRPEHLKLIEEAVKTSDQAKQLRALQVLVQENYGLPMYEAVERAKVILSSSSESRIELQMNKVLLNATISRMEFERFIGPDARAVEQCIDRALAAADLQADDVDVVLRTGGSSRVPLFERMLRDKFGPLKIQDMDAFTSVASGLAVAAWERSMGCAEIE
jgi:hypothetical chaperone protein